MVLVNAGQQASAAPPSTAIGGLAARKCAAEFIRVYPP